MSESKGHEGGELMFAGSASHSLTGRSGKTAESGDGVEERLLQTFSRLQPMIGIKITKIFSGPVSCHSVAVDDVGQAYIWGRNEHGQLGLGDLRNRYNPTPFSVGEEDETVMGASCGATHTMVFTDRGNVFSCGKNDAGQLGIGRMGSPSKTWQGVSVKSAVSVSCGRDFRCAGRSQREPGGGGGQEEGREGGGEGGYGVGEGGG